MSEQPIITLEELKNIIKNVDLVNIRHKVSKDHFRYDSYKIIKDGIEIKFIPPFGLSDVSNVVFKVGADKEGVWETYNIGYYDLIKPLNDKVYATKEERRKVILEVFGIEDKPSDSL